MKEAREAIEEVVDNEKALAAVCLSEHAAGRPLDTKSGDACATSNTATLASAAASWHTPGMRAAAALLSSYERQVQSVEGALKVRQWVDPRLNRLLVHP